MKGQSQSGIAGAVKSLGPRKSCENAVLRFRGHPIVVLVRLASPIKPPSHSDVKGRASPG